MMTTLFEREMMVYADMMSNKRLKHRGSVSGRVVVHLNKQVEHDKLM